MRIHIAGNSTDVETMQECCSTASLMTEDVARRLIRSQLAEHPWRLFSYLYIQKLSDPGIVVRMFESNSMIIDSGLFSFMFGSEKGRLDPIYEVYRDYTKQYLSDLNEWGYAGWIVESDTHRLLGMKATKRLRKLFEEKEDRTIFVWHQPEGLDGLEKLALRYDYVALSIPELRMLAGNGIVGGGSDVVPRMVNDLLARIHSVCKRNGVLPPKVHLLGCTSERMMQTRLAWSCDSTSWLSGVRFGNGYVWHPTNGLRSVGLRSEMFRRYRAATLAKFPEAVEFADSRQKSEYYYDTLTCARAFAEYQSWLDTRISPVRMRGV